MSGLLNVGTRALMANQVALQTAGNNIANVNTPGYSRQSVVLQTAPGQYTGGGYIGSGVDIQTIERNYSAFLTRQSALAGATASADSTRADQLKQLESIFAGGSTGLGAAVSDMLNSFSDVANAPTDLTARTVALSRVDETAARMRSASKSLDDLQQGVSQTLSQDVSAVNGLAQSIANVNQQIARAQGSGQPPNDLLDQRDQLVRDLNQYVQTTSIPASDGTLGIFLAGSQALVLGTTVSPVLIVKDDFGDPLKSKLAINQSGQSITLDENALGGGKVSGLLRFQNSDLNEGRNLLGRLTLAVSTSMNDQHKLGLDLNGNIGGNLFTPTTFGAKNILQPLAPAMLNSATAGNLTLAISDTSKFAASDYEVNFASTTNGTVTRRSDGVSTAFTFTPGTGATGGTFAFQNPATGLNDLPAIDGLVLGAVTTSAPNAGDRFLLKPFSTSASTISSAFSTPSALAVASPVAASASSANTGTLAITNLAAQTVASLIGDTYRIKFNVAAGMTTYDIVDTTTTPATTVSAAQPFVSGQSITYAPVTVPATPGWSLTLSGAAANGDTFTIQPQPAAYRNLNAGNANAMMALRDKPMFDGAALTDGYAGLIAQVGVRAQGANYAATVSSSIATNLESARTGVSGVNLDEEAAKLLQFQQAYQASAKLIQASQNMFDTLIKSLP